MGAKGVGASAAYRQGASVGGGAARDCRASKWGGAACAPKQEGGRSGGCGAARGASRWVWQEPVNKRLSTRARPTGPSVERYLVLVWIIIGLQTAKAAVQGAGYRVQGGCRVQGAGCVRGACGAGRAATVRDPATGVPSLFRKSASFVKKRNPQSAGPCEAVAVGHGARAVRWVRPLSRQGISTACPLGTDLGMSGSSSASKGGRAGAGGGRRWAGPTFRSARRRVLHVRARAKAPCQGRTLACSAAAVGAGWKEGPEERGRGCGAAPGERAEEG